MGELLFSRLENILFCSIGYEPFGEGFEYGGVLDHHVDEDGDDPDW